MTTWKASRLRPWALYDGFVAGAPAVDDSTVEVSGDTLRVKDGGITEAKLAADALSFTAIEERALAPHYLPFEAFRGADGADLAITETAGDFFRNIGTNQQLIDGEAAGNETEVSVGWFDFFLPENYVPGGDIKVRIVGGLIDEATAECGTCTIDASAYLQAADGTVGSDLVTTAAQRIDDAAAGALAPAALDFVVTPTGIEPGDHFIVKVTSSVVETAGNGAGPINSRITAFGFLCDVK